MSIKKSSLAIPSEDGISLQATLLMPSNSNGIAIQINSAMAIQQQFYLDYATYLCQQGFTVITFDYRGIGMSQVDNIDETCMEDWYQKDIPAVTSWIKQYFPELKLVCIGHSLGGQLIGLSPNNDLFDASLTIASGYAYWRHYPLHKKPRILFAFYLLFPLLVKITGKIPGSVLGGKQHIPPQVSKTWLRWCHNPHYMSDVKGNPLRTHFTKQKRIAFLAIADDVDYAPVKCIEKLWKWYPAEKSELVVINPEDYQINKIGHFGFFRKNMPESLWEMTTNWIKHQIPD